MALFVERAAMVGWVPGSEEDCRRVAAICDALDGSALAIELAAARLATRGLDGLEAALGHRLRLLTGGARLDERHRSLRSALDWSYELLSPTDQAVLRQASVFAAPFTAEAATAVVVEPSPLDAADVAETLAHLADQSLLVAVTTAGATRYRMLETIRQYGAELLAVLGEDRAVRERHLAWCQSTGTALAAEAATRAGFEPGEAFDAGFAASADELRSALHWATAAAQRQAEPQLRERAHDLAVSLAQLTYRRGMASEAQRRYEQAASLAADDHAGARLLGLAADVALSRLAGDDALRLFRAASDAARGAGDPRAAALDLARAAELLDRAPGLLSELVHRDRTVELLDEARALAGDDPHVEAALFTVEAGAGPDGLRTAVQEEVQRALDVARRTGDTRLESAALDQLSVQQLSRGEVQAAAATSIRRTELLAPLMPRPDLAFEYSDALHMVSLTCIGAGDLATGLAYARHRYDLPFHRDDAHLGVNWLLVAKALLGDLDDAVELAERFMAGWQRAGRPPLGGFAVTADGAALVEGLRGHDEARRAWQDVAVDMRRNKPPDFRTAYNEVFDAILALHRGAPADALAAVAEDPKALDEWHTGAWRQWYAALHAEAAVLASGDGDRDGDGDRAGDGDRGSAGAVTDADPAELLRHARATVAGNPIATAIVDRAEALASGERDRLPAIAATLAPLSRYQQARTLVLAGGSAAAEGGELMAAMHAVPMA